MADDIKSGTGTHDGTDAMREVLRRLDENDERYESFFKSTSSSITSLGKRVEEMEATVRSKTKEIESRFAESLGIYDAKMGAMAARITELERRFDTKDSTEDDICTATSQLERRLYKLEEKSVGLASRGEVRAMRQIVEGLEHKAAVWPVTKKDGAELDIVIPIRKKPKAPLSSVGSKIGALEQRMRSVEQALTKSSWKVIEQLGVAGSEGDDDQGAVPSTV